VQIPTTKEEIDHVENLFSHVGYPGCLGSIDCVHIPWRKCTWTLQTKCKNKKRGCPTVFFEVVASHITRVLHVSCMFWGCCSDSLIVKFYEDVHEAMGGRYSALPFEVSDINREKIADHGACYNMSAIFFLLYIYVISYLSLNVETGFYFLPDGGYPKVKYLIFPFKWPEVGTDRQNGLPTYSPSKRTLIGPLAPSSTYLDVWLIQLLFKRPISWSKCSMNVVFCTTSFLIKMTHATGGSEWLVVRFFLLKLLMMFLLLKMIFSYTHNAHRNDDEWIIIQYIYAQSIS
jgi:hypothetical protein